MTRHIGSATVCEEVLSLFVGQRPHWYWLLDYLRCGLHLCLGLGFVWCPLALWGSPLAGPVANGVYASWPASAHDLVWVDYALASPSGCVWLLVRWCLDWWVISHSSPSFQVTCVLADLRVCPMSSAVASGDDPCFCLALAVGIRWFGSIRWVESLGLWP